MAYKQPSEYDPTQRRIRAAMDLAGLTFKELAAEIAQLGYTNMSWELLRKLSEDGDDGKNRAERVHKRAVAEACRLPYEWFTVDFARLPELAAPATDDPTVELERLDRLEDEMRKVRGYLTTLAAEAEARQRTARKAKPRWRQAPPAPPR